MALIVGLQNPGAKYEGTRHNIGGDAVGALVDRHGERFKRAKRFIRAEVATLHHEGQSLICVRPTTFMNESGQAIAPLVRYYKADLEELLVVHDDIDLPFAKLRVQFGRGSGGNNGVNSTIRSLGADAFWRLKCGVGRPPGRMSPADFVLQRFREAERTEADLMVQRAADLIEVFAVSGGDSARQRAGELNAL